jgi:predicted lipoprotein with Yx(FWY)xxD motif
VKTGKAIGWVLAGLLVIAGCAAMGGAPASFSGGVLVNSAGMTLYTFDNDQKPGDKTGDGFNKVWHVVEEEWKMMPGGY